MDEKVERLVKSIAGYDAGGAENHDQPDQDKSKGGEKKRFIKSKRPEYFHFSIPSLVQPFPSGP
jgi:hypothetical protein